MVKRATIDYGVCIRPSCDNNLFIVFLDVFKKSLYKKKEYHLTFLCPISGKVFIEFFSSNLFLVKNTVFFLLQQSLKLFTTLLIPFKTNDETDLLCSTSAGSDQDVSCLGGCNVAHVHAAEAIDPLICWTGRRSTPLLFPQIELKFLFLSFSVQNIIERSCKCYLKMYATCSHFVFWLVFEN